MKSISFNCDDSSAWLFRQILNKLEVAGEKRQTRKIRIGGDEFSFVGGCDTVSDIAIDGSLLRSFTLVELQDLESLRRAVISTQAAPIPIPANISVASMSTSTVANGIVDASDGNDSNDDSDLLGSAIATIIKGVVITKVGQDQMFTAFDITKELRQNNNQVHHRDIKQIVHALYNHGDMQGYDRSRVDVNGASIRPFLYHPVSADISTYQG